MISSYEATKKCISIPTRVPQKCILAGDLFMLILVGFDEEDWICVWSNQSSFVWDTTKFPFISCRFWILEQPNQSVPHLFLCVCTSFFTYSHIYCNPLNMFCFKCRVIKFYIGKDKMISFIPHKKNTFHLRKI